MPRRLIGIDVRKSERTGRTTYRVRWRDPDTHKQCSHSFTDKNVAIDARRSIDLAGGRCYCPEHCPPESEPGSYGARGSATMTWGTYARRHIENRPGVGDHYRAQFKRDLEHHMAPLTELSFDRLNRDRVAEWIRSLERAGLSATTIHRLTVQAGSVQRAAIDAGLTTGGNPFAKHRTGRRDRAMSERMHCLTHDEWKKLAQTLPEGVYRDLCIVLVGTGLRFGEATALRVSDVELFAPVKPGGLLRVEQAWKSDGAGGWGVGAPKSRRSRRTVTFGTAVAAALERNVRGKRPDELVFTTPAGTPIRNSNFSMRVWRPTVKAAGLTGLRIHDLRHTHASWLIAEGRPTAAVSRRLGHESIATTDAIYTHILPRVDEDDLAALERAMPVTESAESDPEDPPGT